MVTKALVEDDIDAGQRLREALVSEHFEFDGLFWRYFPEPEEWRLVVVTASVPERGPLATYRKLSTILDRHGLSDDLPLHRLTAASPREKEFKEMRKLIRVRGKNAGKRISDYVVNGTVIQDAYVYFI